MTGFVRFSFFIILAAAAFMDITTMKIGNGCHIAVLILTAVSCIAAPETPVLPRLLGMISVSVPMLILAIVVPGAFGGGDIKLMAVCGLFLGWEITLVSAVLAVFAGAGYGTGLLFAGKADRKTQIAFGPFLCGGMAAGVLFGRQILLYI